ncbi:serine hydrolase [Candidatus Entotheonella palauensis]|uniref:serine hydrolase n=1 Tax=Candidatus Entotheonella palauensis TaxID=93172 RepID=UPI000B7F5C52|nr:serine hydrolase domain-containing protein [Candidatus Entotheonella palauensis]
MPTGLQVTSVLKEASPESQGIALAGLDRLYARIEKHIADDWYPGAAIAMARHGHLVASKTFGTARLGTAAAAAMPVDEETMFLMYSQTKPVTSCAIWMLIEQGLLRFHAGVRTHLLKSHLIGV